MPNDLLAASAIGSGKLPPNLALAVVPLLVLIVALDVYCLIDLARAKSVRNVPKWVWAIVILFVSAPIGALVYLFVGRDRVQDAGHDSAPIPAIAGAGGGGTGTHAEAGTDRGAGAGRDAGADRGAGAGDAGSIASTGAAAGRETGGPADLQPGDRAPATGPPIVTTSGLTRDYGGAGLFDVDLVVPRGSIYGLVGPNGAGKTTLLSLLSEVRRPDRGTISMHMGATRSRSARTCPSSTAG